MSVCCVAKDNFISKKHKGRGDIMFPTMCTCFTFKILFNVWNLYFHLTLVYIMSLLMIDLRRNMKKSIHISNKATPQCDAFERNKKDFSQHYGQFVT